MRAIGDAILCGVVFVMVFVAGSYLRRSLGEPPLVVATAALTAAWAASAETKAVTAKVRKALDAIGLKQDAAAAILGVDASLLSRWLHDERPMNLPLMLGKLGPDFALAFGNELMGKRGRRCARRRAA
jgi:hypothetical protein